MDKVKCCLCNCNETKSIYKDVVQCINCGLYIKKNIPDKKTVMNQLKGFLLSACHNKTTLGERMGQAHRQVDYLEKYIKYNPYRKNKVFDVGAASGFFMKAAQERGWEVEGNDISKAAVDWAKNNYNIDIYYNYLEDIEVKDNSFDAVVLWNTLEHTHSPSETIAIAKRILKPGGLIFIKIPEKGVPELLKKYYENMHFYEFGMDVLTKYLESQDFEEKEIYKEYWNSDRIPATEYLFQLKK